MFINFEDFVNENMLTKYYKDNPNKLMDIDNNIALPKTKKEMGSFELAEKNLKKYNLEFLNIENNVKNLLEKYLQYFNENFLSYTKFRISKTVMQMLNDLTPKNLQSVLNQNGINEYNNKSNFRKEIDGIVNYMKNNTAWNRLEKHSFERGMTVAAYLYAIDWISYFTSMAGNKIPVEAYPYIKKATIEKNIPKTIYRGFFIDGAKVNDKIKKSFVVGNRPETKLKKITSWTTSLETAIEFTNPNDNIKDIKNGIGIVLKATPKVENMIGDLRNFEIGDFYNQMEIIMDENFVDYEVYMIKKGNYVPNSKNIKHTDYYGGLANATKTEILLNPFSYWSYKGGESERELLKTFIDKTPLEISKTSKYDLSYFVNNNLNQTVQQKLNNSTISMNALFYGINIGTQGVLNFEVIDKNTLDINFIVAYGEGASSFSRQYRAKVNAIFTQ